MGFEQQVTRSIEVPAEAERVWEVLTDRDQLGRWLEADVDLDIRPGGDGVVREAGGTVRRVVVEDVEPPGRLTFHWWPADRDGATPAEAGATIVEIRIVRAPGGTRVTVTETAAAWSAGPLALARVHVLA